MNQTDKSRKSYDKAKLYFQVTPFAVVDIKVPIDGKLANLRLCGWHEHLKQIFNFLPNLHNVHATYV